MPQKCGPAGTTPASSPPLLPEPPSVGLPREPLAPATGGVGGAGDGTVLTARPEKIAPPNATSSRAAITAPVTITHGGRFFCCAGLAYSTGAAGVGAGAFGAVAVS